ncbi:MAG: ABC transporter substrate-binding protein [Lachnospiraceae bacterium]|nr:ABC transporter substrate-binding protein [Lachnospiraceae bacterium]
MKKKLVSLLLASAMVASLAACGSSGGNTSGGDNKGGDSKSGSGEAIRIINGKIEIDKQLKAFAKAYEEETGQAVTIESMGGGVDIQGQIKGYYQAGNMPDLFVIGGDGDFANWKDQVADLSDCAFAKDTDMAYTDDSGKVVGFPYAVEGHGITYNKEMLDKAGIDPATLINYEGFKAAFEKLDGMKEELGIDAVCSVAAESGQMYWSSGNHVFGYYTSGGQARDDKSIFDQISKGEFDDARLAQFGKFFELLCKYSDQKILISGTYDDQMAQWMNKKSVFITQGNWIDVSFKDYNGEFDSGIAPLAFTEEDMTGILADSPSWWCAYKDGKNLDAVKKFLDYLATSEEGQKCLVEECGMVSPYKSCKLSPSTPLAKSVSQYIADDNTYAWDWSNLKEGYAQRCIGGILESYAKGDLDNAGFVKMMKSQTKAYMNQ